MSVTVSRYHDDGGLGGISPAGVPEFLRALEVNGHAIVTDSAHHRPSNHYIIGIGVGHDDAKFCESGTSHAAYLENGEAFGGRWWEDDPDRCGSSLAYYDQDHPRFADKTGRAAAS